MPSGALRSIGRSAARAICRAPLVRPGLLPLVKAGLVPRFVGGRLPVNATFVVPFGGGRFRYSSFDGDELGRVLYWDGIGGYEGEAVGEFCAVSASARLVIDVGACTGFYTLLALGSNPNCQVIAFEPLPANRERGEGESPRKQLGTPLHAPARVRIRHVPCQQASCTADSGRSYILEQPEPQRIPRDVGRTG